MESLPASSALHSNSQQLRFDIQAYQNRISTFRIEPERLDLVTLFSLSDSHELPVGVFDLPTGVASLEVNGGWGLFWGPDPAAERVHGGLMGGL